MPKLWSSSIEAHRRTVHEAIVDTVAEVVAEHGLRGVTMSRIAEQTGIGRATLYKYFPDVGSILAAWHERQIRAHLDHLNDVRDRAAAPRDRLKAVLEAYALVTRESRGHRDTALAALLHSDQHVERATDQVRSIVSELVAEAATAGEVRDDMEPDELAAYCVAALGAAASLPSRAAVERLLVLTLGGLEPVAA